MFLICIYIFLYTGGQKDASKTNVQQALRKLNLIAFDHSKILGYPTISQGNLSLIVFICSKPYKQFVSKTKSYYLCHSRRMFVL